MINTNYIPLLFCSLFCFSSCNNKMTPETYLIRDGYKGFVYVIYNKQYGHDEQMEHGRRLYVIPESGVLFTKFKQEFGTMDQKYYYVDSLGNRKELKELDTRYFGDGFADWKKEHPSPSKNQIFIINPGYTGKIERIDEGKKNNYEYMSLYIGTFSSGDVTPDQESNFIDKLDSLANIQLKK